MTFINKCKAFCFHNSVDYHHYSICHWKPNKSENNHITIYTKRTTKQNKETILCYLQTSSSGKTQLLLQRKKWNATLSLDNWESKWITKNASSFTMFDFAFSILNRFKCHNSMLDPFLHCSFYTLCLRLQTQFI